MEQEAEHAAAFLHPEFPWQAMTAQLHSDRPHVSQPPVSSVDTVRARSVTSIVGTRRIRRCVEGDTVALHARPACGEGDDKDAKADRAQPRRHS